MTHDELIEATARAIVASDGGPIPEIRSWHRRYARAAIHVIAPAVEQETVAKIVAWLRTDPDAAYKPADAIEAGEWK